MPVANGKFSATTTGSIWPVMSMTMTRCLRFSATARRPSRRRAIPCGIARSRTTTVRVPDVRSIRLTTPAVASLTSTSCSDTRSTFIGPPNPVTIGVAALSFRRSSSPLSKLAAITSPLMRTATPVALETG